MGPDQGGVRALGHYNGIVGRRRLWIIVGAALALVAVVLGLAVLRTQTPFRFLEGHEPYEIYRSEGRQGRMYSWRADWGDFVEEAADELRRQGFAFRTGVSIKESYANGFIEFDKGTDSKGVSAYDEFVILLRGRVPPGRKWLVDEKGWITVNTYVRDRPLSLWDRIKAVFGL